MAAFYSLLCKAIKKQPAGRSGRLFWRSGRDSNPRAIARKLISSPAPKRLLRNRAGQSWSVCPRIFGGVKPFSRGQSPQKWLWYESNRHPPFWPRLASFFGKMQDFMQDNWGLISLMNTGFVLPGRKTDFSKCKILGRFCVLSFEHSTICIVLAENTVVLRVQIQNKGEAKK